MGNACNRGTANNCPNLSDVFLQVQVNGTCVGTDVSCGFENWRQGIANVTKGDPLQCHLGCATWAKIGQGNVTWGELLDPSKGYVGTPSPCGSWPACTKEDLTAISNALDAYAKNPEWFGMPANWRTALKVPTWPTGYYCCNTKRS
jgi:hypothetical protein